MPRRPRAGRAARIRNTLSRSLTLPAARPYAGAADLQLMIDLLVSIRPPVRVADYPGIVDLRELLALPAVQRNTRLWFGPDNRLAAFALVDHYHNLRFELAPSASTRALEGAIVAWGLECVRRDTPAAETPPTLDASCLADDAERIALLQRHGFVRQPEYSLRLARPLDQPIRAAHLPPGFTIRPVAGEHEAPALVALHRAAFGTEHMTLAERLAMMRGPDYDPALDLLAVAPDGRLAAYCLCSISREENARTGRREGYTDPVAAHPDFQRRGLARALLLTGLLALKQRGLDTAVLGTSSENIAMRRTAEAVGFRLQSTTYWFARPVSPRQPAG